MKIRVTHVRLMFALGLLSLGAVLLAGAGDQF
jgi:hypothetical protein